MANSNDKLNLLINDTMVPDIFVVQYMEQLSKNAVFYYLWIKMAFGNGTFTSDEALKAAPYIEEDVKKALAELISAGLLMFKNDIYSFIDIKRREVNSYCKHVAAMGINPDTLSLTADEEARNLLAASISSTCFNGKMAYCYYALIDKCIGEYEFNSDVVYYLFDIAKQKRMQFQYPRVCKLAEEWYKQGINTVERVDEYIKREEEVHKMTKLVGKITRKHLNDFDITIITKWVSEYRISSDLVEYAFRVNAFREHLNTQIIEETLVLWRENNISTVEEAEIFEEEKHKENKRKATRRKNKGNNWKTGSEAGIEVQDKGEEESDKVQNTANEGDIGLDIEDDILNLFEDDDEND